MAANFHSSISSTQRGLNYLHMTSTYLGYPVKKKKMKSYLKFLICKATFETGGLIEFSFLGL